MKKIIFILTASIFILSCNIANSQKIEGEINLTSITRAVEDLFEVYSVELWITEPDANIIFDANSTLIEPQEPTEILYYSDFLEEQATGEANPIQEEENTPPTDDGGILEPVVEDYGFKFIDKNTVGFSVLPGQTFKFTFRVTGYKEGVLKVYKGETTAYLGSDTTLSIDLKETAASESTTF